MQKPFILRVVTACAALGAVLWGCVTRSQNSGMSASSDATPAERLRNMVTSGQIGSVEDLLARMDDYYSVFVYSSRSNIQEASPRFPRVIHFDRGGSVFYAFGGDSRAKGGQLVESMEFDEKARRFDLYLYDFAGPKPTVLKNPKGQHDCAACHSSDPVPLWESYPVWPGVYGSEHQPVNQDIAHRRNEGFSDILRTALKDDPESMTRYRHIRSLGWYLDERAAGTNTLFGKVISRRLVERLHRIFTEHLTRSGQSQALAALALIPYEERSTDFAGIDFLPFLKALDRDKVQENLVVLKRHFDDRLKRTQQAKVGRAKLLAELEGEPESPEITF